MGNAGRIGASRSGNWLVFLAIALLFLVHVSASIAETTTSTPETGDTQLYLDVQVNGKSKGLIAEFVQDPDGRIRTRASELKAINIDPGPDVVETDWIYLETLGGVQFSYDPALQTISFAMDPERTAISNYDLRGTIDQAPLLKPSTGAVLNYTLTGQAASDTTSWEPEFNGASALLDARMFSPLGTFSQSGLVSLRGVQTAAFDMRRLDTSWSRSDPTRQITYTAGDFIGGGLSWTRPIRMGGVSARRNFATRPDLITRPLPNFSGTALVPSTIDVFLGDLRLSSIDVDAGRYSLNNIPVSDQTGDLRFAVRDASGTVRQETLSFAGSPALLRKGLVDFSFDAGVARTGYGSDDDSYGGDAIGVGSLRYGLADNLTAEAHTELGAGLTNSGIGLTASLAKMGTINVAVAGSNFGDKQGGLVSLGYSYNRPSYSVRAETRRTFGDYRDLADVTAENAFSIDNLDRFIALDRVQLNTHLTGSKASFGLGYTHTERQNTEHSHILNASLAYQFNPQSRIYLNGFTEIGGQQRSSIYAGLSVSLGADKYLTSGAGFEAGEYAVDTSVSKAAKQEPNSWGYGASLRKTKRNTQLEARATHLGERMRTTALVTGSNESVGVYGSIEGSAALIDGQVDLMQRVDDSFAVVDAGAPGVRVYRENQLVGKTGGDGKLFVGGIRSYEANKLSIEPTDLPLDSSISATSRKISLPEKSGTVIRFVDQDKGTRSGLVVFINDAREFLPAGTTGKNLTSGEQFVVGYDGEAFLEDLKPENTVEISLGLSTCTAQFKQGVAEPVVCTER